MAANRDTVVPVALLQARAGRARRGRKSRVSRPSTVSLDPIGGPASGVIEALRDWLDGGVDPLVIATSGSTGEPKHVILPREAVLASAPATHQRLGGPGQWLLALPVTGIAGVQVVVRSLLAGFEPVLRDDF